MDIKHFHTYFHQHLHKRSTVLFYSHLTAFQIFQSTALFCYCTTCFLLGGGVQIMHCTKLLNSEYIKHYQAK